MMFVTVCRILVVKTCDQDALHEQRFLHFWLCSEQLYEGCLVHSRFCFKGKETWRQKGRRREKKKK